MAAVSPPQPKKRVRSGFWITSLSHQTDVLCLRSWHSQFQQCKVKGTPSPPQIYLLTLLWRTTDGKSTCCRRREFLPAQRVPSGWVAQLCHQGKGHQPPGLRQHPPTSTAVTAWESSSCHWCCVGECSPVGSGVRPFPKAPQGELACSSSLGPLPARGNASAQAFSGIATKERNGTNFTCAVQAGYNQSRNGSFITFFFFPVTAPSIFPKGKMQIC